MPDENRKIFSLCLQECWQSKSWNYLAKHGTFLDELPNVKTKAYNITSLGLTEVAFEEQKYDVKQILGWNLNSIFSKIKVKVPEEMIQNLDLDKVRNCLSVQLPAFSIETMELYTMAAMVYFRSG